MIFVRGGQEFSFFPLLFQCLAERVRTRGPAPAATWRQPSPRPPSHPSTRTTTRTLCPPPTRPPRTTTRAPRATTRATMMGRATTTTPLSAPQRQARSRAGGGAAPPSLCSRGTRGDARLDQPRATGTLRPGWQVREEEREREKERGMRDKHRLFSGGDADSDPHPLTCLSNFPPLLPTNKQNRRRLRRARGPGRGARPRVPAHPRRG